MWKRQHWSFYTVPKYNYFGKEVTLVITDTGNKINERYYILELPVGSADGCITNQTIVMYEPEEFGKFIFLDVSFKNNIDIIKQNNYNYGNAILPNGDSIVK